MRVSIEVLVYRCEIGQGMLGCALASAKKINETKRTMNEREQEMFLWENGVLVNLS